MRMGNVQFWPAYNNRLDDQKDRWRLITIGMGKGDTPLGGGGKAYRFFLTLSLRNRIFRYRTESRKFWVCLLGLELSFKYGFKQFACPKPA